MEQIRVQLPDGSIKEVVKGTTVEDVARGISPRLLKAADVNSKRCKTIFHSHWSKIVL